MGERMDKRIRFYIYWILGFVLLGACAPGDKEDVYTEMRAFEDFSHINGDSVAIVPRKVRLKASTRRRSWRLSFTTLRRKSSMKG